MNEISIARVYEEIIQFYQSLDIRSEIFEFVGSEIVIENNNDGERMVIGYTNEEDVLINQEKAYRIYDSEVQKESDSERIRRYLTSHFTFLMTNVFYLDLSRISKGRTYYIPEKDYPVIKEILLRSVSQHESDRIIGRWLDGKIRDDSYHEIFELSRHLFYIINSIEDVETDTRDQWIAALRIAIRSDLAYGMVNAESILQNIFSNSLPFVPNGNDFTPAYMHQKEIAEELDTCLNDIALKAQNHTLPAVYHYLETMSNNLTESPLSFPPLELMQTKSICEYLYDRQSLKESYPNPDVVDTYIKYFQSVDNSYSKKLQARKERDKERYKQKKKDD